MIVKSQWFQETDFLRVPNCYVNADPGFPAKMTPGPQLPRVSRLVTSNRHWPVTSGEAGALTVGHCATNTSNNLWRGGRGVLTVIKAGLPQPSSSAAWPAQCDTALTIIENI